MGQRHSSFEQHTGRHYSHDENIQHCATNWWYYASNQQACVSHSCLAISTRINRYTVLNRRRAQYLRCLVTPTLANLPSLLNQLNPLNPPNPLKPLQFNPLLLLSLLKPQQKPRPPLQLQALRQPKQRSPRRRPRMTKSLQLLQQLPRRWTSLALIKTNEITTSPSLLVKLV